MNDVPLHSESATVMCLRHLGDKRDNNVFTFPRLQEKHVKEKQCEHQRNILELQDKLKKNQIQVHGEYQS